MMTPFDRLDRMASRSVDWMNAQPFVLIPMIWPANGRGHQDEARPVIAGKGVLDYKNEYLGLEIGNRHPTSKRNDFRTAIYGSVPSFSVDRRVFDDINGDTIEDAVIRQGDHIQVDGKTLQVASARPDGHSRISCTLTKTGGPNGTA